jgi:lipopolysaccharide/colanic/teichoic acid biosynthesis glycosyltransferase
MRGSYYRTSKRLIDVAGSLAGLILASPVFIAVAILIKCDDGGAVFFRQIRMGQHGRPFTLWKFRTMREGAERSGVLITARGDARITAAGRMLRKTKIDELPQLWNVLRGDMSLVGPRPETLKYAAAWRQIDPRIARVRPGMTSPASLLYADEAAVLARYAEPEQAYIREVLPAKVAIDVRHFEQASVLRDAAVLAATLKRLCFPMSRDGTGVARESAARPTAAEKGSAARKQA